MLLEWEIQRHIYIFVKYIFLIYRSLEYLVKLTTHRALSASLFRATRSIDWEMKYTLRNEARNGKLGPRAIVCWNICSFPTTIARAQSAATSERYDNIIFIFFNNLKYILYHIVSKLITPLHVLNNAYPFYSFFPLFVIDRYFIILKFIHRKPH